LIILKDKLKTHLFVLNFNLLSKPIIDYLIMKTYY